MIMNNQLDVSVAILTYFHENTISQAIESVLSQKTSYRYEIVISDDGSTDRTRDVLLKYKEKYPNIIKLNFNESNLGITENYYRSRLLCKGKYIATLSGDDYWIDDNKLQYQLDFLENHLDYFAIGCSIEGRFDDDSESFAIYPKKKYRDATITLSDYLRGAMFGTNGMVIRNAFLSEEGRNYFSLIPKASKYIDDATECILILNKGPIYISQNRFVVYRVLRNTNNQHNFNSIHTTIDKCRKSIDLYNNLNQLLEPKIDLFNMYKVHVAIAFLQSVLKCNFREFKDLYYAIPKEYRRRCLLLRSCPYMFKVSYTKILNSCLSRKAYD